MTISKKLRWGGLLGYMLIIFVLSSIPGNTLQETGFFHHDKLLHLIEYGFLGSLSALLVLHPEKMEAGSVVRMDYALAIGIGWTYAVFDEIHQYFVPGRMMEMNDFIADAVGVVLGVVAYRWVMKKIFVKQGSTA
ncbi:MAG: VanZ family protein [Candidatus Marinimicrobia bacterium]|nr:VanZ family protein [Candidatus Neomarinimicrobiota bacterium]MCF7880279.1 VanZ family protein [Candidatus Neomarinimicrobiota bacterium]